MISSLIFCTTFIKPTESKGHFHPNKDKIQLENNNNNKSNNTNINNNKKANKQQTKNRMNVIEVYVAPEYLYVKTSTRGVRVVIPVNPVS